MVEEKVVIGKGTEYPLNGILTLPSKIIKTPIPAVVFVHGSGPSNMDEKVGKLTPFKDLAEGLFERGIASIRYDKRTFAHKKKLIKEYDMGKLTVEEETIQDVLLATEFLRNDPRIDPNKIFIIGHSMGGMLAPRIDAEGGNYKGIVIMAGSPRKLEEILIDQNYDVYNSLNPLFKPVVLKNIKKLEKIFENIYTMGNLEAQNTPILNKYIMAYYFKEMGEKEVSQYLRNLNKPMLIMQGEQDCQVSVENDFNKYKELLENNENATFKLYRDLNHAFVQSTYGKNIMKVKKEYNIEKHIESYVINDIANWVISVCALERKDTCRYISDNF